MSVMEKEVSVVIERASEDRPFIVAGTMAARGLKGMAEGMYGDSIKGCLSDRCNGLFCTYSSFSELSVFYSPSLPKQKF